MRNRIGRPGTAAAARALVAGPLAGPRSRPLAAATGHRAACASAA